MRAVAAAAQNLAIDSFLRSTVQTCHTLGRIDDPVPLQKLKNVACCVIECKSNRTISPARDEDTYLVFTRAQASDGSCRRVDTAAASRRSMSFYIDYAHNHHHRSSSIPYSNGDGVPVDAEDPLH